MRTVVLFMVVLSLASSAWCGLCRFPLPDRNHPYEGKGSIKDIQANFSAGAPYSIVGGSSLRNRKKKEPGFLKKLAWHSWIEVYGHDGCIYSFGLAGTHPENPSTIVTPDSVVRTCYTRLSDCLLTTHQGRVYELGGRENLFRVEKNAPSQCRFVCQGIENYIEKGINKEYPLFKTWRAGKLNSDQVAIIHWLIRNGTLHEKSGSRVASIPFRYQLLCSVPGAQTLAWLKKMANPNILDVANCQTFAADFDAHPGDLLEKLKAYKF